MLIPITNHHMRLISLDSPLLNSKSRLLTGFLSYMSTNRKRGMQW